MDAAREVFAKLKLLKVFDFYHTPSLTSEQQGWLQLVCDLYLDASPEERGNIRSLVTPEISFLFFMYAKAMAVEAVRERDEAKVVNGLIALAIEDGVFDWRDSLTALTLLHHSAIKVAADASKLFQRAAAFSTPRTADRFLQFLNLPPEDRDISRFGWKEGTDPYGRFAYTAK
jgi:hypothetical protein